MAEHQAEVSASARELAREVLIHGPISRAELGRRLGLSPASLTRLSKPFLDRGWFIEASETVQGATGRPATPLDVQVDSRRFVGVKLAGESAFGVITDLRAGALDKGERRLAAHEVDAVVAAVADLVVELRDGDGVEVSGLGVSIGGNVAGQRVVTRAPFLGWRDVALADLLERELGIPVTIENDVTALTTAEQWFGDVRGRPAFAVVTIGAGVGYGLVVHDRVITTPDSGLGLGGHLPLDPNGPLCGDGHRGCSTAMLSIPSITAQLGIALGHEVDYDEVLRLAREGHPLAVSVTAAAGRALGRMMAGIANIAMVDTIVLSGEGVGLWNVVGDVALAALAEDRDAEATPVEVHVDDAGFVSWARGAAAVAIQAALGRLRLPA
ncbi:ROK family transcriptional regulator [Agromyces sp. Soil535]|uniref:ROK family transcriptional regulator n=1 Tax=Agromyces sp. Soil535 TaxID=1736390 RepID=UPI0006F493AE|nr:ROK family transcriptional regulator [Agromyces sp. Soil535]KRE30008.1 MarR family transcriptional regulator [Agromyces sp. Soil535]